MTNNHGRWRQAARVDLRMVFELIRCRATNHYEVYDENLCYVDDECRRTALIAAMFLLDSLNVFCTRERSESQKRQLHSRHDVNLING